MNDSDSRPEPLRAGYVAFGSDFYEPARLAEISAEAERQLTTAGIELVRTDPVYSLGQEERAVRELGSASWDFLIANVINWIEYRAATRVLLSFRARPMVLYSFGGFTEDGTLISPAAGAGSTSLRFPLERWGVRFKYLFHGPDQTMDTDGVVTFGRAARAVRKLRTARVGMVGWNDMGLYTTAFDITRLRGQLGPEVESVDLLQVQRAMEALDAEAVRAEVERITANWDYPTGKPSPATVEMAVRLYLATLEICRQKRFAAFSYKSVEGLSLVLKVLHSIPSSLVASAGIPYVDENDVGNLVAELMLKWISGGPVTFLEHYEHHPEWILLGVDGYVPEQMIAGRRRIKRTDLLVEGIADASIMRQGRMTLACLAETGKGYRLHVATGEARPAPRWIEMGTHLPSWASVTFVSDAPVRSILDHVMSQHFAAAYGDWSGELADLCRLLDVEMVLDS